jgi:monofunctional glycosyltransferase
MRSLGRWLGLCVLALAGLQLFFVLRIASMTVVAPQSTAFQRSQAWRILTQADTLHWQQDWVNYAALGTPIQRAVIASEDDGFASHDGVDWDALKKAWAKNAKAQERAEKQAPKQAQKSTNAKPPKVVGGSTITQQLAKNLFLSGERTLVRKGQEFVLTLALETCLSKERILEIYLNNVEWGDGVFGAQAAAQHYFRKSSAQLSNYEAARLAVMLPRPKFFEKTPGSAYLSNRAATIVARMGDAELP